MHLTVENGFLEDYEAARAALSHSHPNAGMAEILQLGLQALAERHAKRKGLVKRPRNRRRLVPRTRTAYRRT